MTASTLFRSQEATQDILRGAKVAPVLLGAAFASLDKDLRSRHLLDVGDSMSMSLTPDNVKLRNFYSGLGFGTIEGHEEMPLVDEELLIGQFLAQTPLLGL